MPPSDVSTQLRQNEWIYPMRKSEIHHVPLRLSHHARDQGRVECLIVQPFGEEDRMDGRATDVQPPNDSNDLNWTWQHGFHHTTTRLAWGMPQGKTLLLLARIPILELAGARQEMGEGFGKAPFEANISVPEVKIRLSHQ